MNTLASTLKDHGYSLTKPRQAVFKALQDQEPQTIHQLIRACPGIDRASVYRTVTTFEQLGIIKRLQIGWKYKLELSDDFQHHHHHLTCQNCHQTFALAEDSELETRLRLLAAREHFKIRDHQVEILGICKSCRKP